MGRLGPAGNGQACPAKSDCHRCSGGRHRLDTDRRRAATLPGAVAGPPSTRDTWQRLGTFPMSQPVGNTTGLWRAEARGAATCPAARATQCQEPALKAQPCRVTPLVESQKSQSSKAEQIGSGGNGVGGQGSATTGWDWPSSASRARRQVRAACHPAEPLGRASVIVALEAGRLRGPQLPKCPMTHLRHRASEATSSTSSSREEITCDPAPAGQGWAQNGQ